LRLVASTEQPVAASTAPAEASVTWGYRAGTAIYPTDRFFGAHSREAGPRVNGGHRCPQRVTGGQSEARCERRLSIGERTSHSSSFTRP
jgi:hypothetical protein